MTINELQEKWNSISPYTGGFLLVSGNHPLAFHIGYYGEQMCFMVLNTGKRSKINSSKAIHASCVQTNDNKYALQFLLNYSSLTELFIKLCWDLIDCSKNSPNPVDAIIDRFNAWIRLLQKKGEGLLSSSAQKGLIGELLFLKESIISRGAQVSLAAWVGPEGSDQDYLFESEWCEIKATTIASVSVSISSLQQLDREDFGKLSKRRKRFTRVMMCVRYRTRKAMTTISLLLQPVLMRLLKTAKEMVGSQFVSLQECQERARLLLA